MAANTLELLAPARDADIGIEAINHGADAVYIGGPAFGARDKAPNSIEDLARLVAHAHRYHARIYVTLNTILRDDELEGARRQAWDLYNAGVDALIVQDMALLADRPAADPAARQHAVRHAHAGEGALPAGRRLLQDHPGARAHAAADPRGERAGRSRDAGVLHPRRTVRGVLRPVLHQPCAHRPQRQPRQLLAGVPPALHGHRLAGPRDRAREARAVDQGQRPERQPRGAGPRRRAQLQGRGPLQGHGLREERHRALPAVVRRAARGPQRPARRVVGRAPRSASSPIRSATSTAAPATTSSTAAPTTWARSTRPNTPGCRSGTWCAWARPRSTSSSTTRRRSSPTETA